MAKTVKELKEKMINAIDEIDLSKLSGYELSTLAMAVKAIGEIQEENQFISAFKEFAGLKDTTLKDLKERE